jgi:phage protein D
MQLTETAAHASKHAGYRAAPLMCKGATEVSEATIVANNNDLSISKRASTVSR